MTNAYKNYSFERCEDLIEQCLCMSNQYNKYDSLEYYELIQENSQMVPRIDNDVSHHRKLNVLCLKEG